MFYLSVYHLQSSNFDLHGSITGSPTLCKWPLSGDFPAAPRDLGGQWANWDEWTSPEVEFYLVHVSDSKKSDG